MKSLLSRLLFSTFGVFAITLAFPQDPSLYTVVPDAGFIDKFDSTRMGPKIFVKFAPLVLSGSDNDRLEIRLPDFNNPNGRRVVIIKDKQDPKGGQFAWYGRIKNQPGSFVLITGVNNIFSGHLRTADNKLYSIEYRTNGIHRVALINQDFFKPDQVVDLSVNYHNNLREIDKLTQEAAACCDGNVIDVLVLYTKEAREAVERAEGIIPIIYQSRNITNESFIKSNIPARVEIVHYQEVEYQESGSVVTDRNALIAGRDQSLSAINSLRDQYAADVVCLIVESSGSAAYSGVGAVMSEISPAFEADAFFVIRRDAIFSNLGFAHELGHILGSRHHCGMDWELTPFPYNHGYAAGQHSTIMAKEPGYLRIEYWSDTALIFPQTGERAGNANGRCQAIDAACLRQTIATVSRFRCKQPCTSFGTRSASIVIDSPKPPDRPDPPEPPEPAPSKTNWLWLIVAGIVILGLLIWFTTKKKNS